MMPPNPNGPFSDESSIANSHIHRWQDSDMLSQRIEIATEIAQNPNLGVSGLFDLAQQLLCPQERANSNNIRVAVRGGNIPSIIVSGENDWKFSIGTFLPSELHIGEKKVVLVGRNEGEKEQLPVKCVHGSATHIISLGMGCLTFTRFQEIRTGFRNIVLASKYSAHTPTIDDLPSSFVNFVTETLLYSLKPKPKTIHEAMMHTEEVKAFIARMSS